MIATFQNSAFVLSIGIFFILMVAGLFEPAALVAQDEREDLQASGP